MSLDELRERIKNELVLHEGNIADWQWNRTGLPTEAKELGISDFLRLVDDVARALNAQFGKILELQAVIRKVATDSQKRLSDVQIGGFALEAERLGLSRSFVFEQWVPRIVAQIPDPDQTQVPASPRPPEKPTNVPTPAQTPAAAPETAATMQQKVRDSLDDYKEYIPAQAIRTLFRTISYDENALADTVLTYLRDNFYASETEPQGATLRDKLTSTNWRHLVWWDRQSAQATPPPAQPAAQPAPQPSPTMPAPPPARQSSGLRDMLFALLIAGGLIGFVIFLIKSRGQSTPNEGSATTEQIDETRDRETGQSASVEAREQRRKRKKRREADPANTDTQVPSQRLETRDEPSTPLPSPRTEPYDELLNDVGQYGERPAQKDGQWGLWRKGRWMVLPVYDDIAVFKDGRARVTVNGNSYDIDRNGNRIRE